MKKTINLGGEPPKVDFEGTVCVRLTNEQVKLLRIIRREIPELKSDSEAVRAAIYRTYFNLQKK